MKKNLLIILVMIVCFAAHDVQAKKWPVIKFDKTTYHMGTFSQDEPIQVCVFKFRNVGKAPLVITLVHPSCGCTVADYPKDPIPVGGTGEIRLTYDGSHNMPGKVQKHAQVFTNCKDDMMRLWIVGTMSAMPAKDLKRN